MNHIRSDLNPVQPWLRAAATALLLVTVALASPGCESEGPNVGATLSDITDNPGYYYGRTVTVSGEVNEVYGPRTFTIGGGTFGPDELLVLSADSVRIAPGRTAAEPVAAGDIVQVTGVVEPLIRSDVEEAYGIGIEDALAVTFEDRPVLIARSTAAVAEPILVTPRTAVREPLTDTAPLSDPGAIARDGTAVSGRRVLLEDASVGEVVSDRVFWVTSEDGERLLVVLSEPAADPVVPGGQVDVEGTAEAIQAEADLGTDWGLGAAEAEQLRGEQVYVRAERADLVRGQ